MYAMKHKIIQLFCFLLLFACQKNDIEVFNGSNTNLDKLQGNWVVINYWADWCAPCIKEIPELNEFANENKDILLYDFVLKSWTKGINKITINTNMTNFAIDGSQNLIYLSNIRILQL